jgi:hypothetical protein
MATESVRTIPEFNQALADDICARVAESSRSLANICKELGTNVRNVYYWLNTNEEFRQQYARAKEDQADWLADEIVEIADETEHDTIEDDQGKKKPNMEWIARSRLRVDARKWVAAKLKPKKYADKITNEHTGANGGPIQTQQITGFEIK